MKTKKLGFKHPTWKDALGNEFTVGDKVIYEDYGSLYEGIVSHEAGWSLRINQIGCNWGRQIRHDLIEKKVVLKEKLI